MRKSTGRIKRALALFLVVLMSIESFAAVVSDNDGAAFITKAEFDSLKNDFQSQINRYNESIDNKIDGAIAAYLEGASVSKRELIRNRYNEYELPDGQKFRLLKWSNSNTFTVNACDRVNGTKDWQRIWNNLTWYNNGERWDQGLGKSGIVYGHQSSAAESKQVRIEVDQFGRIIAWGDYAIGFDSFNLQKLVGQNAAVVMGAWLPVDRSNYQTTARRPLNWNINLNTLGDGKFNSRTDMIELAGTKCFELMPSETNMFDMSKLKIAPLSTAYEAMIGPQLAQSDTTKFTTVDNTSNEYGATVMSDGGQVEVDTDTLRSKYNISKHSKATWAMSNIQPRVYSDMEARWFDCRKYNESKFQCIYAAYGFDVPIKCGVPITSTMRISREDRVIVNIENAGSNGFIIPYLSQTPDPDWGGAKVDYTAGDRYSLSQGTKKEIDLSVNDDGDYYLFVVWLPDTACVLPDLSIYHEKK